MLTNSRITPFGGKVEAESGTAISSEQIKALAREAATKVCNVGVYISPLTGVSMYEGQERRQDLVRVQNKFIAELVQAGITHGVRAFGSVDDEQSDVQVVLSFSPTSGQGQGIWYRDGENENDKHRLNAWYEKLKATPEQRKFMQSKGWDLQERPLSTDDVFNAVSLWRVHGSHSARGGPARHVYATYDKFKNLTFIQTDFIDINSALRFNVYYACDGSSEDCHPSTLGIAFSFTSSEWAFRKRTRSVIFLVDDSRISLGEADWDGDVLNGGVHEQMTVNISPAQLATIALGTRVEGQLATETFTLSPEAIFLLREMARKVAN